MKTKIIIFILSSLILTSCGLFDKDDDKNLDGYTSAQLQTMGWQAFQNRRWNEAERYFSALTLRADDYLIGHYGLGWTYLRRHSYINARNEFNSFFTLDINNIFGPTDSVTRNVRAGQTFVFSALHENDQVIVVSQPFVASTVVNNNWSFTYDERIDINDIRLLRATSQFLLGRFRDACDTIRLIDSSFEVDDIQFLTVEGRLMLQMKLDALYASR